MNKQFVRRGIPIFVFLFLACLLFQKTSIQDMAIKTFLPGLTATTEADEEFSWGLPQVEMLFPFYHYVQENQLAAVETEDQYTYEMILMQQAFDESVMSEDLVTESAGTTTPAVQPDFSMEKLRDFNYLLNRFYTVDSTTMIGAEQLNADTLLSYNLKIDKKTSGPKVLIFHTHSQETFVDSVAGDANTSIVGVGAYLAEQLNAKGIETIHHKGVYDLIDGKLDRSKAYELSEAGVREILKQYPSIEVVIDLHRDGVPENLHLVTDINGKKVAKIMFFNGLSRTKSQGNIAYLKNPYIQDNLAFSLQMQLEMEQNYPGMARKIYLKGYRYSLHMMPKSLLIEAGAQTNTVEETKNAMELLANVLAEVLL